MLVDILQNIAIFFIAIVCIILRSEIKDITKIPKGGKLNAENKSKMSKM